MQAIWNDEQIALWQRLCEHRFERPQNGLDLTRRLAREEGWSLSQARAAVDEYRRFCFLACVVGNEVTPSKEVDAVWHLHLIHTWDYWQVFCPQVLGTELHHGPTRGGPADDQRYRAQYAETLAHYERWFSAPPVAFWPGTVARFRPEAAVLRIDPKQYWLLRKPEWLSLPRMQAAAMALFGLMSAKPALALSANPLDWTAAPFLELFLLLMILSLIATTVLRGKLRDYGQARAQSPSAFDLAYLAGNATRCADAGIAQLLADEVVVWDGAAGKLKIQGPTSRLEPPLDAIARCIAADGSPDRVVKRCEVALQPVKKSLQARGLCLDDASAWRVRSLSTLPVLLVCGLGGAKIMVGISRAKPVGFLIVLTIMMVIAALLFLLIKPTRTRAGDLALKDAKQKQARALRAPRKQEIGIAVALLGTAALSGTAYAGYHTARTPPSSDSSSGGGTDSSGDGSGGGGGCGGCGGGGD